ncbi:MAG: choline-sulfatase [Geminicoccaceae bacterium]
MPTERPNFLFIQCDQLAARALKAYGNKTVKAPNIDRLAERGVVFESAYCNLPMCGPSRASMMCGQRPFSIGMYDNASEFHADIPTFAHYLRSFGYRTWLAGKMHFVGPDQMHGFEKRLTTEIYPANFAWTVDWSKGRECRPTNLTMATVLASGPAIRTMQMDYDDEVAFAGSQALYDLAREDDGRPFFLGVSFTSPHSPYVIGQEYWDRYDHDDIEAPTVAPLDLAAMDHLSRNLHFCQCRDKFSMTVEDRRRARHGYYGMISFVDDHIGRIMDVLEKTGLADNTIVIFTSDHGDMMGERGMWFKQHFFEWAAQIPFIVTAPERYQPTRVAQNISLVDLAPTLVDLAKPGFDGFAVALDGISLAMALEGDSSLLPDIAVSEFAADGSTGPNRMIRKGPWKMMDLEGEDSRLYNVADDPTEVRNLVDDVAHAATRKTLEAELLALWERDAMYEEIRASQRRRLVIHNVTGGDPTYVHAVRYDDAHRYVRNAGAADTKAKARLPRVAEPQPDQQ